jgi:hypothetical protein
MLEKKTEAKATATSNINTVSSKVGFLRMGLALKSQEKKTLNAINTTIASEGKDSFESETISISADNGSERANA